VKKFLYETDTKTFACDNIATVTHEPNS